MARALRFALRSTGGPGQCSHTRGGLHPGRCAFRTEQQTPYVLGGRDSAREADDTRKLRDKGTAAMSQNPCSATVFRPSGACVVVDGDIEHRLSSAALGLSITARQGRPSGSRRMRSNAGMPWFGQVSSIGLSVLSYASRVMCMRASLRCQAARGELGPVVRGLQLSPNSRARSREARLLPIGSVTQRRFRPPLQERA